MASMLRYDVTVVPKQAIPFTLVNHVVRAGLPANILAVTQRAEQVRPPDPSGACDQLPCEQRGALLS